MLVIIVIYTILIKPIWIRAIYEMSVRLQMNIIKLMIPIKIESWIFQIIVSKLLILIRMIPIKMVIEILVITVCRYKILIRKMRIKI